MPDPDVHSLKSSNASTKKVLPFLPFLINKSNRLFASLLGISSQNVPSHSCCAKKGSTQRTTHVNIKREDAAAEFCCGFLFPTGIMFVVAGFALSHFYAAIGLTGAAVIGSTFAGVGFGLIALTPLLLLAAGLFFHAFFNHQSATSASQESLTLTPLNSSQRLFSHDGKDDDPLESSIDATDSNESNKESLHSHSCL